ncbi:MAG: collagen-like protein, partial [Firmicutes bacterium]|nr:collagen-like protein [Bacillota bacterium]
ETIEKTDSEGLTDTYTITFTDGTTSTFTVANGEKGETGAQGIQGEIGLQGEKGEQGETGEQGIQGETGEQGEKGETGEQGIQGESGAAGQQGEKGEKGDKGDTGEKGEKGDTGEKGEKGDTGAQGERGATGATGATGQQGEKGEKGKDGKDGAGIADMKIEDGALIVTLTNGTVINAGQIPTSKDSERTSLSGPAGVKSYFFDVEYGDVTDVFIDQTLVGPEEYSVEEYGDGVLLTINENILPKSGGTITVNRESGKAASVSTAVPAAAVPAWLYAVLAIMAAAIVFLGVQVYKKK